MRYRINFSIWCVGLFCSCGFSPVKPEDSNRQDFCQEKFSPNAKMTEKMGSQKSGGDESIAIDYISGFACMVEKDPRINCPNGMTEISGPGYEGWCTSKVYPLSDLCIQPGIKQSKFKKAWVDKYCASKGLK